MNIVCLDVEGVLVPEIWIAFAEASGIPELRRTTRDEPDYDKLMRWRLGILKEHGLGLREIQKVISTIDPLPGARAFLDALRARTQVILISDTFEQFAGPLMEKLGRPTLFCNTLDVAPDGSIAGYRLRVEKSKLATVRALQSIGFDFVKTSTGFASGGATAGDVALMRRTVGKSMGVKAAGGIRDRETAEAMLAAGATRIGTSAGVKIAAARA